MFATKLQRYSHKNSTDVSRGYPLILNLERITIVMNRPVDTGPALTTDGGLPSQAAPVTGVEKERVDPYTLQIIDQLFPGHHGTQFLARILRHASIKQLALPELAFPEVADVAVITVQSLRALARLIGFSYDTTEKYIVVLSRLHLLHKKRSRRQIILHFPLCRCQVPEPEALERLDYRPKVTSFAGQVKRRMILLRTSTRIEPPSPSLTVVQDNAQHLAPQLLEDIRKILQQEVDSETGSRLLLKIEGAVRYRCTQSQRRLSEQKDDSETVTSGQQSRLLGAKGDSVSDEIHQERRLFGGKDDSLVREEASTASGSPFGREKDDFEIVTSDQQSRLLGAKGDSVSDETYQERRLFEPKGDSVVGEGASPASESTFSRPKGDFQGAASSASLNDNVITIFNDSSEKGDDNDNDAALSTLNPYSPSEAAQVGRQLALFLEKSPQNIGGFVNKCKLYSPIVIRASVIDVLVHAAFPQVDPADERGRPKNRASWFHNACKNYGKPGSHIPAFIEKWRRTDLAWDEIERQLSEAAIHYKRYMIADSRTADLVRKFLRGEIEQQVLDEALQTSALSQEKQPLTLASSAAKGTPVVASQPAATAEKTWMDEDEAELLAEEILRDAGPLGVSKAVAKQEHSVFVVVLTWRGISLTMKTPHQWRTHLDKVQRSMALQQQLREQGEQHGTDQ